MADPTGGSGGTNLAPLLEGLSALVLALTGGIATIVGVLRKTAPQPPKENTQPEPDNYGQRLALSVLDMHERDLQARDEDYARVNRRMHRLEELLNTNGIRVPTWEETNGPE